MPQTLRRFLCPAPQTFHQEDRVENSCEVPGSTATFALAKNPPDREAESVAILNVKPEQQTRQEKIDLQLGRAGWSIGSRQIIGEYVVSPTSLKDAEKPFNSTGDTEGLFMKSELDDLPELTRFAAA